MALAFRETGEAVVAEKKTPEAQKTDPPAGKFVVLLFGNASSALVYTLLSDVSLLFHII